MSRKFLGWQKPILELAATELADRAQSPGLSLQHLVVVVPGQRAARALLAKLTEYAEQRGTALIPPTLVTTGRLPELLYDTPVTQISELEAELLWVSILRQQLELVSRMLSGAAEPQSLAQLHGLARTLLTLRSELGVLGDPIPQLVTRKLQEYVVTTERWEAVADLMHEFERELASRHLTDLHLARAAALAERKFLSGLPIILLGTLDLSPVAKRMLRESDACFEAWIHAPAELAEGFDAFGAVEPHFWRDYAVQIEEQQIAVGQGAAAQAQEVVRQIARWSHDSPQVGADDIVVAAPDPGVAPHVQQALAQYQIPVRNSSGVAELHTGPGSMLALVVAFLASGTIQDLGSLTRHPDMLRWLNARAELKPYEHELISLLDRYQSEALPLHVVTPDQGHTTLVGGARPRAAVDAVLAALRHLEITPCNDTKTLAAWVPMLRRVLREIYGARRLRRGLNEEKIELESLEVLDTELMAIERLSCDYGIRVSFAEMMGFVLRRASTHSIEPNTFDEAVEIVGWLELYFDERPYVAVAGCNEGFLPETLTSDPFLPNEIRKQLGLVHNDIRYARDCAVLAAVLRSRASVLCVFGSRGREGEALAPSQLLLTDSATRVQRVLRLYGDSERERTAVSGCEIVRKPQPLLPRDPALPSSPVERVSVTGLSRYLECPYRFYLQYVKKLAVLRDDARELDALAFGSLGHAVLSSLVPGSECANLEDPRLLQDALQQRLSELVSQRYGEHVVPAVQLQLAQLRLRLAGFARWQAQWRSQGWRVRMIEKDLLGQIETERGVLGISAKLDRVDEHQESGQLAVFDYKFQDLEKTADEMHRGAAGSSNLQLPLYRMVLRQNGFGGQLNLAILSLSGEQRGGVAPSWLNFAEADFEAAEVRAREAAINILAGVFWGVSSKSYPEDPFKWICAVGVSDEEYGSAGEDSHA